MQNFSNLVQWEHYQIEDWMEEVKIQRKTGHILKTVRDPDTYGQGYY